ncbi:hypothetical protein [Leifsonia sp. SIMBA_070]|uniref:hypothetical protein n=1 Tax=Leifsonia sp. SIMBA_070 TaxID=3085810 RepID=UPI003979538E
MSEQTDVDRDAGMTRETVLRPHRHLFTRGIVTVLALTTPVFAVLYWLTIPGPGWPFVLVAHLVVIAATIVGVASFLNTTIILGPDGVRERGFFGRTTHVAPGEAGAVIVVQVYEGSTLDVLPQLFVASKEGRLLIRMRGQFWSPGDMEHVAEELDVPVTRPEEPMTLNQLRRAWPRLLYWFERIRIVR